MSAPPPRYTDSFAPPSTAHSMSMDIINDIIGRPGPYASIIEAIKLRSEPRLRQDVRELVLRCPNDRLASPMRRCIDASWLEGFNICLDKAYEVEEDLVATAALAANPAFLLCILDNRRWQINSPLRGGRVPSVAWYATL